MTTRLELAELRASVEQPADAERWDAQTSADLAALIAQYLAAHPAPADSRTASAWQHYAHDLALDAELRFECLELPGRHLSEVK